EGAQRGATAGALHPDRPEPGHHRAGQPAPEPGANEVLLLRPERDLPGHHRPEEELVGDREMVTGQNGPALGRYVLQPFNLGPPAQQQGFTRSGLADPVERQHWSSGDESGGRAGDTVTDTRPGRGIRRGSP